MADPVTVDAAQVRCERIARELALAINKVGAESGSHTPDFILGAHLGKVLQAFGEAVLARDRWYGVRLEPGAGAAALPPATVYVMTVHDPGLNDLVRDLFVYSDAGEAVAAAWRWANGRVLEGTQVQVRDCTRDELLVLSFAVGLQGEPMTVRVRARTVDRDVPAQPAPLR